MQISKAVTPDTETKPIGMNKVLRNTYALLSMTLLFSVLTSGIAVALNVPVLE